MNKRLRHIISLAKFETICDFTAPFAYLFAYLYAENELLAAISALVVTVANVFYQIKFKGHLLPRTHLILVSELIFLTLDFLGEFYVLGHWAIVISAWIGACGLISGYSILKVNIFEMLLGDQISLSELSTARLHYGWSLAFIIVGMLSVLLGLNLSESDFAYYWRIISIALSITLISAMFLYLHFKGELSTKKTS
jgi:intracellular septation protein A